MGLLQKIQEKKVISVFRQLAKRLPSYKALLEQSNVDCRNIRNIRDFREKVPILNKEKLFTSPAPDITDCSSILPSSGHSGTFSFGVVSKEALKKQKDSIDKVTDLFFETSRKKTLLINTLSMGIGIPASTVTTVNTGLRGDAALYIVRTFAKQFDQIILVGENTFIKNLLEQGLEEGIAWQDYCAHVVFGGESFPESFRAYIEGIVGKKKGAVVGSSFGFAEIGLNVLWETPETIKMRKNTQPSPMLFQYNPLDLYVEEVSGRLVFTKLDPDARIPIIRYATGDEGFIVSGEVVAVKGKNQLPDMIKDAFYSSPRIPPLITGFFKIKKTGRRIGLEVQLKKGASASEDIFRAALKKCAGFDFDLRLYPYKEFPYAMEMDFERKFRYIGD